MIPSGKWWRRTLSALLLIASGCGQELGPERLPTAKVRGTIQAGGRPIGGGFIEFHPVDGTVGNLRVGPIRPDGSFEVDGVPVGRVAIGLAQLPAATLAGAGVPVEPQAFRLGPDAIRRAIPDRGDAELPIDLIDEAVRIVRRRRANPRRRKRPPRQPGGAAIVADLAGDPFALAPVPPRGEPLVRVVFRDSAGAIHLDWPAGQVDRAIADAGGIVWVDIEDLESANNSHVEAMLRDVFRFHPLAVEDALKDTHVPKVDDWGGYLYLVVDTLDFDPETDDLRLHELDLFLGPNYLVTYHNEPTPVLERHRRNLEREPEHRLQHGPSHLLYRLLDDVVAEFLPAIEHLDDAIDDAQDEVFRNATTRTLQKIFQVKRSALRLHRVVTPMREVLNRLARDPYPRVNVEHRVYFRDVYDHLVRIHDIVESLRDLISGALDTYLSVVSNRTNEIMKALTIVNVMFLPMSFIAGFFGMNFFGDTLMLQSPALPKATIFWLTVTAMIGTPVGLWHLARRRGWF